MMTFPKLSRKSSNSYSCQPMMDCSTNTSWVGEACKPLFKAASKSFGSCTNPPPVPPKVKDGRITNGKPVSCAISFPSRNERAVRPLQTPTPISIIFNRNFSRSSVVSIAAISTPMIRTPYFSQIPAASQSMAKFKAVWPPIVGNTASI